MRPRCIILVVAACTIGSCMDPSCNGQPCLSVWPTKTQPWGHAGVHVSAALPGCTSVNPPLMRGSELAALSRRCVASSMAAAATLRHAQPQPLGAAAARPAHSSIRRSRHTPCLLLLPLQRARGIAGALAGRAVQLGDCLELGHSVLGDCDLDGLGLHDERLLQQALDGVAGLRAVGQPLLDGRCVQVGLLLQRVVPPTPRIMSIAQSLPVHGTSGLHAGSNATHPRYSSGRPSRRSRLSMATRR